MEQLPAELQSGVYFGWARVGAGPVHPMVMSIGWNPQFMNKERSMVRERERQEGCGGGGG